MTTGPVPHDAIDAYGAAWLEPDPERRLACLGVAWADDAVYADPLDHVVGRTALCDHIGATQAMIPGGRVEIATAPVRHHDGAFFRWRMSDAAGATIMTGFDVVQFDTAGRIARLTGFFDTDTAPPAD